MSIVRWFLALLSLSPVFLRTPLLFGARPCPGDESDLAMALTMNPSCLKQTVSQQRWTTQATITLKKKKNHCKALRQFTLPNGEVASSELASVDDETGMRMWGVLGFRFGPVVAVCPVSEIPIRQGVQLLPFISCLHCAHPHLCFCEPCCSSVHGLVRAMKPTWQWL